MTIFWLKPAHSNAPAAPSEAVAAEPEFDEDGRRYVFRYAPTQPRQYTVDRDRLFHYAKQHELPGARARMLRRDLRNAANFYEDVREIQTHPDVSVVETQSSLEPVTRLRLRSA